VINVKYRTIEDLRGQYFDCPFGFATLTTQACAKSYKLAMSSRGLRKGLRIVCKACPVGAMHAGTPKAEVSESRFLGCGFCSRCQSDARRLIRGSICVSCYNRERELLIGKNAKGGKPIFARPISSISIAFTVGEDARVIVRRMDKVSSYLEAIISIQRTQPKQVVYGWVGGSIIHNELEG